MITESGPKAESLPSYDQSLETSESTFVEAFAEALEEKVTATNSGFSDEDFRAVSEFRTSRKLPGTKPFRETLIKVAQDFRFTPDEIDTLEDRFLSR